MHMETREFNKLVRDRIPEIIASNGETAITKVLTREQFKTSINKKLVEEVQEFLSSGSVEELVDIFQVILAILEEQGIPFEEFDAMRKQKAFANGEFKKKVFLIRVEK